jgi:hypothetical protein
LLVELRSRPADAEGKGLSAKSGAALPLRLPDTLSERGFDLNDGSISSIVIEGLPEGARLNLGKNRGDRTWSLSPTDAASANLLPPPGLEEDRELTLTVRVLGADDEGLSVVSTVALFDIKVAASTATPTVSEVEEALNAARAEWEAERDQAIAQALAEHSAAEGARINGLEAQIRAEAERSLTDANKRWASNETERLTSLEETYKAEVERRIEAARSVWESEQTERVAKLESAWRAETEEKLARAETEWRTAEIDRRRTAAEEQKKAEEDQLAKARGVLER